MVILKHFKPPPEQAACPPLPAEPTGPEGHRTYEAGLHGIVGLQLPSVCFSRSCSDHWEHKRLPQCCRRRFFQGENAANGNKVNRVCNMRIFLQRIIFSLSLIVWNVPDFIAGKHSLSSHSQISARWLVKQSLLTDPYPKMLLKSQEFYVILCCSDARYC